MSNEITQFLAKNSVLLSVANVVALLTAVYYTIKLVIWGATSLWKSTNPRIMSYAQKRLDRSLARTEMASQDATFLIAESGKTLVVVIFLLASYFLILVGSEVSSAGDASKVSIFDRVGRNVLAAAAAYNLGRLHRWFSDVAKRKWKERGGGK